MPDAAHSRTCEHSAHAAHPVCAACAVRAYSEHAAYSSIQFEHTAYSSILLEHTAHAACPRCAAACPRAWRPARAGGADLYARPPRAASVHGRRRLASPAVRRSRRLHRGQASASRSSRSRRQRVIADRRPASLCRWRRGGPRGSAGGRSESAQRGAGRAWCAERSDGWLRHAAAAWVAGSVAGPQAGSVAGPQAGCRRGLEAVGLTASVSPVLGLARLRPPASQPSESPSRQPSQSPRQPGPVSGGLEWLGRRTQACASPEAAPPVRTPRAASLRHATPLPQTGRVSKAPRPSGPAGPSGRNTLALDSFARVPVKLCANEICK